MVQEVNGPHKPATVRRGISVCGNHPRVTPSGLIPPMTEENQSGARLVLHITAPPDPEELSKVSQKLSFFFALFHLGNFFITSELDRCLRGAGENDVLGLPD